MKCKEGHLVKTKHEEEKANPEDSIGEKIRR